jgi:1-acyl-sn-glycerol-3-phosphate acyltransferase
VGKREIANWPVLGTHLRDLGVMFVQRDDPFSGANVLRQAARALAAGVAVLNFPEGTTTTGETVLPFRRGIFGLAMRLQVPIVPVRIDFADRELAWVGDATLLPHYVATAARKTIRVRVRYGPPLLPDDATTADAFARLSRFMICHDLTESPSDEPASRLRLPATRTDSVLPIAARQGRAARPGGLRGR